MTRSELLAVVYLFYPRGMSFGGAGYSDTEERKRQRDVARRAVAGCPTWEAMLDRLRPRYQLTRHSERIRGRRYLEDGSYDPAYSADIEIPGHRLGFHVSVLGPYYGIRRLGAPGEEPAARDLAREIEATYPGYEAIPPELGDEVVPDVCLDSKYFGSATIYECLLSELWENSSGPWPPPRALLPSEAERLAQQAPVERLWERAGARGFQFRIVPRVPEREAGEVLEDDPDTEAGEPRQR